MLEALGTTLEEIAAALAVCPPSARVREQRAKLVTYRRVFEEWKYREPTNAQKGALLDCVLTLYKQVKGPRSIAPAAARTLPPPPSARSIPPPRVNIASVPPQATWRPPRNRP